MDTKFNLILIDDDDLFLLLNVREIKKANFHPNPITFLSAEEAIQWLSNDAPKNMPMLVLLDINMPGMDGWGFLKFLNQNDDYKDIKVVMATSSSDPNDKVKAEMFKHVIGFIEKPIDNAAIEALKNKPEVIALMA